MTGIIPRSKAKGTGICVMRGYHCIIRSDLGCYMRSSDLHYGKDIQIHSLHPSCQNGDHYIGHYDNCFYIIKGNSYRKVCCISTDVEAKVYSLHPNCQGGDHYCAFYSTFYIIFQEKGTYRRTTNLNKDLDAVEQDLPPEWRNGLYYWEYFCFLKPASEWGVDFYKSKTTDREAGDYSLHPNIVKFLPGGLSVNKGPAVGRWVNIKTLTNDTNSPWTWKNKIKKKVGYNKEMTKEITHNWKIATSVTLESGDLAKLIAKFQLSFSTEYGGSHVNTEQESWEEATEVEEELTIELKPNKSVYLWQYQLGLGKDPVLFCRDLLIDDVPTPPTKVPLPTAQP